MIRPRAVLLLLAPLALTGLGPGQDAPASRPVATATVQGRVLLDEGIAAGPGLEIKLVVRIGDDRWHTYDLGLDGTGRFQHQGIEAGRGTIRIEAAGWFTKRVKDLRFREGETSQVDPIDLRGKLHLLRFTVVDADTRAPVAGAGVWGSVLGPSWGATDSHGRFALVAGSKQLMVGLWSRPYGRCPHKKIWNGAEVALQRWIRVRVRLGGSIPVATRSIESDDRAGILVAGTESVVERSAPGGIPWEDPELAVVGMERTVELFVHEAGTYKIWLTRADRDFKGWLDLQRLCGPFPVKIAEGQREAEVTLTCDTWTAFKIRTGLRKAGLR